MNLEERIGFLEARIVELESGQNDQIGRLSARFTRMEERIDALGVLKEKSHGRPPVRYDPDEVQHYAPKYEGIARQITAYIQRQAHYVIKGALVTGLAPLGRNALDATIRQMKNDGRLYAQYDANNRAYFHIQPFELEDLDKAGQGVALEERHPFFDGGER